MNCWSRLSVLTKTMTGRNGAGTTYIPGRSPTWVTNPAAGARVTVWSRSHCASASSALRRATDVLTPSMFEESGKPRPLLLGSRAHQRLGRRFEIATKGVDRCLCDDLLFEQFSLPVIVLLRQLALRLALSAAAVA